MYCVFQIFIFRGTVLTELRPLDIGVHRSPHRPSTPLGGCGFFSYTTRTRGIARVSSLHGWPAYPSTYPVSGQLAFTLAACHRALQLIDIGVHRSHHRPGTPSDGCRFFSYTTRTGAIAKVCMAGQHIQVFTLFLINLPSLGRMPSRHRIAQFTCMHVE